MKVYILFGDSFSCYDENIIGVYADREKAEALLESLCDTNEDIDYNIAEWEVRI